MRVKEYSLLLMMEEEKIFLYNFLENVQLNNNGEY